ncbi:hypothetical protein MTR67_001829 [Solanum verrucosum]|uniref:Uncharacterized protein n=1 Tax=Solanum verrucosum TaxID=315347 RepID=A0AAF0PNX8_SOLVR|nr:hypothetical protein MTR67_001829 [Solanum verrucosum]
MSIWFVEGFSSTASRFSRLTQKKDWPGLCVDAICSVAIHEGCVVSKGRNLQNLRRRGAVVAMSNLSRLLIAMARLLEVASLRLVAKDERCSPLITLLKELVHEVHKLACLGHYLVDSTNGGVVIQNRSESSLVTNLT